MRLNQNRIEFYNGKIDVNNSVLFENISFIDICSTDVYIYANDCNNTLIATISIDNINSFIIGEYNQFTDTYEHEKDIVLFLKQWENDSLRDIAKSLMGV